MAMIGSIELQMEDAEERGPPRRATPAEAAAVEAAVVVASTAKIGLHPPPNSPPSRHPVGAKQKAK